jgi:hypothetical protein
MSTVPLGPDLLVAGKFPCADWVLLSMDALRKLAAYCSLPHLNR